MKRQSKSILSTLLCAALLTGLLSGCVGGVAPAETPPAATEAPGPAPETEGPDLSTEEPTPEPDPLEAVLGVWELWSSELDGAETLASEGVERVFLRFRDDGTADYICASPYFDPEVHSGLPVSLTPEGLTLETDPDMGATDFLVVAVSDAELALSYTVNYPDGVRAGGMQLFRRSDEEALAAAPRPLTETEIAEINENWNRSEYGFFLSSYARPEEIDWYEVLYNGGGIAIEPDDEILKAYASEVGHECELDLEVIPGDALRAFVLEKTGTPYAEARKPIRHWTYLDDLDLYCREHGDTNAENIRFSSGWREGDQLVLNFCRSDWSNHREERWFRARVRVLPDGSWQYISVTPEDARDPVELVSIVYSAEQPEADYVLEQPELPSDEPGAWRWALLTAKADGVNLRLDRFVAGNGTEDALATGMGAPSLNTPLGAYTLNAGETVAVNVVAAWNPVMRASAAWRGLWGDYWFGEDNALHLDDAAPDACPRWIMGHDLDGEGRGTAIWSEEDLANFLDVGGGSYDEWLYYDDAGCALAALRFRDYRALEIERVDYGCRVFLDYEFVDAAWDGVDGVWPGFSNWVLLMEKYNAEDYDWSPLPEGWFADGGLGDYVLRVEQLEGEQILTLRQFNNGDGALGFLLGVGDEVREFSFRRAVGTLGD